MIAKAIKGRGFRGAVSYDLNDEKGYRLDSNMAGETPRQLAAEFGAVRALRPNLKKAVAHVSLAAAPGETLSDDQWREIAQDYLAGMGYDDNQYLVTRHTDTDHDHIHIIANRIKHGGGVVSDAHDYRRQEKIMREIEQRHGLQAVRSSHEATEKPLSKGEIEQAMRTGDEPPRQALQRLVGEAAQGNPTASQFADRLAGAGVEVRANIASTGRMNGFSFGLDGKNFSGSKLGKGFTWKALQEKGVSYEQDRDREALERLTDRAKAGAGDPNGGRAATPVDRDQRADQPDPRDDRAADGGQSRKPEPDQPAAAIGSPGPDDQASRDGLRSADSGAGRTDQEGDRIDGHDKRPGEDRYTEVAAVHPKGSGGDRSEGQQRGAGRRQGQGSQPGGQEAGPPREHTRPQHRQADGGGHGPVGLAGLAGDLRNLADRHVITPEKAQAQIAQAIEDSPAPRAHDNLTPPTKLQRWYDGMKSKLRDAVDKAREFFTSRTEDSATDAGWQPDQLAEAGLEGPTANGWRERQRKEQEQAEKLEQERQRRKDRVLAAEQLSNEHQRIITEDEVAQDPNTGEWRYEPPEPPQAPEPETPDDAPDMGENRHDEPDERPKWPGMG